MPATDWSSHPFAHIAPGPYKFRGLQNTEDRALIQATRESEGLSFTTNLCGGSCDHCGTAIFNVFFFEGANGKRFKVGADCAEKAEEEIEGKLPTRSLAAARLAAKEARNAKARERAAAKRKSTAARAAELLAERGELARAQPHPLAWRAERGDTLADWCAWMLANGGAPAAKRVIAALEGLGVAA